jgi:hypothetical protein
MTPEIQRLIEDGRWQPIENAPKDADILLLGEQCHAVAYWWVNEWSPCSVLSSDSELDCGLSFEPTHFRPLPDNRLADALEVAVRALQNQQEWLEDLILAKLEPACTKDNLREIKKALAEIKTIAERKE